MTVSTSVRRVGTVSAATVALVLSGGGLALASTLPSDIGSTLTTTTGTTTGILPTSDPLPLPTTSPLPLPLPTTSPTPTPTQSPTPTPTSDPAPAPAQTALPALPGTGSGSGSTGSGSTGTGGTTLAGGTTSKTTKTSIGSRRTSNAGNETYSAGSSGALTSWALPSLDLGPSLDLPGGTTLVHGPGVGAQPLMAAAQPEVVQLAGAASSPQVAPAATPEDKRQAAGLVIIFAIVTIGGVAAGHASLLQQRLAHRSA